MTPTAEWITPFWFKQRQCKLEPMDQANRIKITGPNLADAYLEVRPVDSTWKASLRLAPEGPEVAVAEAASPTERAAWDVAFELYRTHVIA